MSFKKFAFSASLVAVAAMAFAPSSEAAQRRTKVSYTAEDTKERDLSSKSLPVKAIHHTKVARASNNQDGLIVRKNKAKKPRIIVTALSTKKKATSAQAEKVAPAQTVEASAVEPTPTKAELVEQAAPTSDALAMRTRVREPRPAPFKFGAQLKNYITSAPRYELEVIGGASHTTKNELILSLKHSSEWGLGVSGAYKTASFDDKTKDSYGFTDATLLLYHPKLVKTDSFSLFGWGRVYFPTSEKSVKINRTEYAYYSIMTLDLGSGFGLENTLIPRYISTSTNKDDDTVTVVEHEIAMTYAATDWMSPSAAVYTNMSGTRRAGSSTESYFTPYISFQPLKSLLIEPKGYFPLFIEPNKGGPANASLQNIAAELYVKLTY